MPEPTKVAIAGDWHGNGGWAEHVIHRAHEEGADVMIQVGDFGYWVPGMGTDMYLKRVSAAVRETGIAFHWLAGNHEYWPGLPGDAGRGTHPSLVNGNLIYLPIGYRWEWWGKKFMAVGGAFSIDRFMRSEGKSYWEEELLTDDDVTWCTHQPHGVDVMFAHDCPTGVNIPGIGPESKPRGGTSLWPPLMLAGAAAHRRKLKEIWDAHRPQLFYHGHYHVPHITYYGPTIFQGMDMDGTSYHDNVTYLVPEDLE